MSLSLATRGYLCSALRTLPPPVTPPVISVQEDKPDVTGATVEKKAKPRGKNAAIDKPSLRGATVAPPSAPTTKPKVTKAKTDTPTVRRAKKD